MPKTVFNVEINPGAPDWMRDEVFSRDAYTCQYCGQADGDLIPEHVIPFLQGGHTAAYNLVAACVSCNCRKRCLVWLPANIAVLEADNAAWAQRIRERAATDAPTQDRRNNLKTFSYLMPVETGERLRRWARMVADRPVGEVAEEALLEYLERHEQEGATP